MIAVEGTKPLLRKFSFPQIVIARFTARRTWRMAAIWGTLFGLSSLSSIIGFENLYKSSISKEQLVNAFSHNAGLNALFGIPNRLDTAGGFTTWRMLGIAVLIGGIWGLLTSTKSFRGEEEAGRWEIFLCGQTTMRKAVANTLAGLTLALVPLALTPAIFVYVAGVSNNLNYSLLSALFFGIAISASAAIFMSFGALASQLAPIRRRAAMYTALFFGISFLIRAAGDAATSLSWLTNLSPLGWVEKLHPLTSSNPGWLIPIMCSIAIFSFAAIFLAGRRDLGASLIADKDSSKPKLKLLNSAFGLSLRLEKNAIIGWSIGAGFVGLLYGYIAKAAVDVIKNANGAGKALDKISGASHVAAIEAFMGVVFLLLMIVVMVEATALVGAMRSEESNGFLDNLLVRATSRLGWLGGRLLITIMSLIIAVTAGTILAWVATASQHISIAFHMMITAGINILPADLFIMSVGILVLGLRPRLTTAVMYGLIAWSFLIEMIGPAINLNHYLLDTSVLHHIALAPAVKPNWNAAIILLLLGATMITIGFIGFDERDLQGE